MKTSIITHSGGIRVAFRPASESKEAFLVRHFGPKYFYVEPLTSDWPKKAADIRNTSAWHWYEAPGLVFGRVGLRTPYYAGNVSVDAAGIIACLQTFGLLAFQRQGEAFEWHFRWLRRFAVRHIEAIEILDACEC